MTNWILLILTGLVVDAFAQTTPSSLPGKPPVSEQLLKQAESPFRWILLHSRPSNKPVTTRSELTRKAVAKSEEKPSEISGGGTTTAVVSPPEAARLPAVTALSGDGVMTVSNAVAVAPVIQPLRLIRQVSPSIPDRLMNDIVEETVVVRCLVTTDGSVKVLRVLRSTQAKLDGHVVAAIGQWQYQPLPFEREVDVTVNIRP